MSTTRQLIILIGIFFIALNFRIWLTNAVPQPFIYDQVQYEEYAQKIYSAPFMLASHSYRTYPAPLLFAAVYKLAGPGNHTAVYLMLAIIDSASALLLYWIIKHATGNRTSGLIASALYAVNPLTATNTGVITSEVLTTFFISASLLAGVIFVSKPTTGVGIILGICAGLSFQTRPAMTIGALVIIFMVFMWVKWKAHRIALLGIICGVVLTLLYPLYTNWRDYREFTPFKVDSFYAMEFYNGVTLKILPPFAQSWDYPIEQQIMWREFWSEYQPGRTTTQRRDIAQKYIRMGWNIIKTDPVDYIRWRFYKMWYVWQKDNIYPYSEPGYEIHRPFTFWGNTILLGLSLVGAITGFLAKKQKVGKWLWISMIGILISQTVAFSFSHAESRLTLPLYPLIFIFAASGIAGWESKPHPH